MITPWESASLANDLTEGVATLAVQDPVLFACLQKERTRQMQTLTMVASSSVADPSVLACSAAAIANLTTEGYPGSRYHAGCAFADEVERLAIERARTAFKARYANVQPHSCTTANQAVMFSLLNAGDTILGLGLKAGGHLTHGAPVACSGKYFHAIHYGLDEHGLIDYEGVRELALRHRPKLIICGASAYPRAIRFDLFREIADSVEAILLADISHIAGLIIAGAHPSPIDIADVTTTSTYKQLFGPRGGMILMGASHARVVPSIGMTLEEILQRAVFPFFQGTPDLASIAAKARALALALTPEFAQCGRQTVRNARVLAQALHDKNYEIVTGGTDNHIVLLSLRNNGITGKVAESALEDCGIVVNKNVINGDRRPPSLCSGIRFGTNTLTYRGMGDAEMHTCARLIDNVLRSLTVTSDTEYELARATQRSVRIEVAALCSAFPVPGYSDKWAEAH